MKKLLVVAVVMLVASMANAGLLISVDGVVNPADSEVILVPSQTAIIDVHSDGLSLTGAYFLAIEGPGMFGDVSGAINTVVANTPDAPSIIDISEGAGVMLFMDMALPVVPIPPIPQGKVIDLLQFHCEGPGDVTLILTNEAGEIMDTQIIHQIPEPMTMALLGLGALLIRRK